MPLLIKETLKQYLKSQLELSQKPILYFRMVYILLVVRFALLDEV